MKNIIVPFDFSSQAENGVTLALELASKFQSQVLFAYVQRKEPDFAHLGLQDERRIAEAEFEKLIARLQPQAAPGVKLNYVIQQGKIYREIVALAESSEDSVIVTATHGASGFEEFFIGSNTLRILAATDTPIYTIRHGITPAPIQKIIFPLDLTFESRQKAPYVARLARTWNATVHVLGMTEASNEEVQIRMWNYMKQVENFFVKQGVTHEMLRFTNTEIVEGTLEYAAKHPNSLIALTSREKESYHLFMIGGKVQRMLSQAPVPVLVLAPTIEPITYSFKAGG